MNFQELHQIFSEQVYPSEPNDWDIEDALDDLEEITEEQQLLLLNAIPTVWPVSHSLAFSFLKEGARHARKIDKETLAEWLRRILYNYEEGGLLQARRYMAEPDLGLFEKVEMAVKVSLSSSLGRLLPFTRGISGLDLRLQESHRTYTDSETLYLPEEVVFFEDAADNLLYYKLIIGLLSCCILQGSFGRHRFLFGEEESEEQLLKKTISTDHYFSRFERPGLARDIYQLVELHHAFLMLGREFPGLLKETSVIRQKLWSLRKQDLVVEQTELESFFRAMVLPEERAGEDSHSLLNLSKYETEEKSSLHEKIYNHVLATDPAREQFNFFPFMDPFNFGEVDLVREKRIVDNEKKYITLLADFIAKNQDVSEEEVLAEISTEHTDSARVHRANDSEENDRTGRKQPSRTINNSSLEMSEELEELSRRIQADLGHVPEGYVSAAFGMSGRGINAGDGEKPGDEDQIVEFLPYDEWDYRRQGYRKHWCGLRERVLKEVKSDFYERTLDKHRLTLLKIRRQFEMLNTREHFGRRRRHGDDLDLDALIDSLGDQRAGLAPSEKLFIRLIRNERSISTLFLVDMSNSTEGWIGRAIKEALILICEAMELVGDQYGIYGFSGMRRMRSEVYKIKDLEDPYNLEIKQRLCAIGPKEYTRMGPPIRHISKIFRNIDTKSRLLLILSDGKPEDYDDYKGEYAIEDTRKALAEARGYGIHPYCITIDRESHDYLEHLFGPGNYTYVNKIEQLPARLIDIYRLLTR